MDDPCLRQWGHDRAQADRVLAVGHGRGAGPRGPSVPGAEEFIRRLAASGKPFLVLTNNSIYTRRDLSARLAAAGLVVPAESIWTSALATARFLADQRPEGSAYVIGEAGLTTALHEADFVLTDIDPDYVVLGRPAPTASPRSPARSG